MGKGHISHGIVSISSLPLLSVFLILVFVISFSSQEASAATVTWTGGGGADKNYTNPANWDLGVPSPSDTVIISLPSCPTTQIAGLRFNPVGSYTFTGNLTIGAGCFFIDQDSQTFTNQGTITVQGNYFVAKWKNDSTGNLTINSAGQMAFAGTANENYGQINNYRIFTIAALAALNNTASGTINHYGPAGIWHLDFATSTFRNNGTVYSDDQINIQTSATFQNSGTVNTDCNHTVTGGGSIVNILSGSINNVCGGTPPLAPSTPDLDAGSDSNVNTDNITNVNTPTFTGTAEADSTVEIFADATLVGSGTATGGSYSITTSALSDADYLITATASNIDGTSPASSALSVTIDTTQPTTTITLSGIQDGNLALVAPNAFTNSSSISIPFTTSDGTGSGVASSECKLDSGSYAPCTTPVSYSTLADGSHTVEIRSTDIAGNVESTATFTWQVDTTPPIVTFTINAGAAGTVSSNVKLDMTCNDNVVPLITGSGCGNIIIGGTGLATGSGTFPFSTQRDATLTNYRDIKGANVTFSDNVGHSVGPISDSIALDSKILNVIMSDDGDVAVDGDTPYWEVPVTFTGSVANIGDPINPNSPDTVTFNFGSPTIPSITISDLDNDGNGTFTVTNSYPIISSDSINPHSPSATLRNTAGDVTDSSSAVVSANGPTITVQRHPTTVLLNPISDTYASDLVAATGILVDDITGLGISGKTITFSGNGSAPLSPATTTNFTVNDVGGITVEDSSGDLILRGKVNTEFIFPSNPATVILTLREMGVNTFNVTVTTGDTTTFNATGEGQGINTGIFTLSDAQGISNIKITYVSSGTAGITQVEALNSNVIEYIDEGFTTPVSGLPTTTLPFAQGSFISVGTAQATVTNNLVVNATFAVNTNYEASASTDDPQTNVKIYSVHYATGAGSGGAVAVVADSGTGRTAVQCGAGNDDDLDALCDDWEGTVANGKGIPIVGGGLYNLPGSNPNKKDIYVEIDYMYGHKPFVSGPNNDAIDNVTAAFAKAPVTNVGGESNGITLHVDQGEVLHHDDILTVWTDADSNSTNDFNSVKAANFGCQNNSNCAVPNETTAQKDAKSKAYHYFLFAHSIGGASGVAEQWGNDGIVSLGVNFGEVNGTHDGTEGTINQTAGTFMHELGHNLNLNHGGPVAAANADSGDNCKPNHDSIMTYSRQLPTLLGNLWVLNYSDGGLGPATGLRESGGVVSGVPGNIAELNQTVGFPTVSGNLVHTAVSISPSTRPYVVWGTPSSSYASPSGADIGLVATPANTFSYLQSRANAQQNAQPKDIDWNGDGTIQTGLNLARDINAFGFFGCENNLPLTTYSFKNYNEWTALNYNFTNVPGGQYDGFTADVSTYQIGLPDLDSTQVGQLKVLNAYQQEVSPWDQFSSLTRKANTDVPIKTQLFDASGLRITGSDTTVTFNLYKSGSSTVLNSGTLAYEPDKSPPHWHNVVPIKAPNAKGTYYIEIILNNPGATPPTKTTTDPDTSPQYTNLGKKMSMRLIVN